MYRFVFLLLLARYAFATVQPVFSFKNQEAAIKWSGEVLKLKERYDSKDKKEASEAREEVVELSRQWREEFDVKWPTKDLDSKLEVFADNLWFVGGTNVELAEDKRPWWTSLGKFADLKFSEFKRRFLVDDLLVPKVDINLEKLRIKLFDCLDWRKKNVVTSVKEQAVCDC